MNTQDKYKWNIQKLDGQLAFRGVPQKVMDLHNDAIEALAIELNQQGQDRGQDDMWTEIINMEAGYREMQKELNIIKDDLSDIENDSKRKGTKTK